MKNKPGIITFQKKGLETEGFLSIATTQKEVPFPIKRVFWTYATPVNISRGRHAHYQAEMLLIAIHGHIKVKTICQKGTEAWFELTDPNEGLYIPKMCWHEMFYTEDAVQLVLVSTEYEEADYIRSFEKFKSLIP